MKILTPDEFEFLDQDEEGASDPEIVDAYTTLHTAYERLREAMLTINSQSLDRLESSQSLYKIWELSDNALRGGDGK